MQALRQGEVDLAVDVPAAELPGLASDPHLGTVTARGLRVIFLGSVSVRGVGPSSPPPLADGRVRRALALAIDRERLVREALGGHAEVIDQLIAPEVFGYSAELPRIPYDPEAARKLLATAGYPEGLELTLDFPAERYRSIDAVARQVVADLARVGVRVVLNARSSDVFFARLARQEPELYLMGWICNGDAPLSYDYLLHRHEGSRGSDNDTGLADAELDRLIEATELEPLIAPRGAQLRLIAERVLRDLPLIPLYRQFDLYGLRSGLEFRPRPDRRIRGVEMRWR